ncbi:DUF6000 family protein [Streptomyces erythrochromogenes]|uniref:DUF6000 family protein n=1 Tax=Streptomyces erythrochromogenes TaxID=285574 RepID=UPI0037D1E597
MKVTICTHLLTEALIGACREAPPGQHRNAEGSDSPESDPFRPALLSKPTNQHDRLDRFRTRIGDLLLASEVCYSGAAYRFALARLGTPADAEILTAYLDRHLPRPDLDYDQPAALGALLRLDAHLGTHHADRFTESDGPWDEWVAGTGRSSPTPAELHHWTDLHCDFANAWAHRPGRRLRMNLRANPLQCRGKGMENALGEEATGNAAER